jgi:hypothetical protein
MGLLPQNLLAATCSAKQCGIALTTQVATPRCIPDLYSEGTASLPVMAVCLQKQAQQQVNAGVLLKAGVWRGVSRGSCSLAGAAAPGSGGQ